MKSEKKKGRPVSDAITHKFERIFIDRVLAYKNNVMFERNIHDIIVRATFHVYKGTVAGAVPIYTLTYADNNNSAQLLVDKRVYRTSNLHYLIQDFKRSIADYLCVLSAD